MREALSVLVFDRRDSDPSIELGSIEDSLEAPVGDRVQTGRLGRQGGVGMLGEEIGIQLQPEIREAVRRVVGIGDGLGAGDAVIFLIDLDVDDVVGSLLPIGGTGSA